MNLKIIHITNNFSLGGVSSVLYELVKESSAGFEHGIVNLTGKGDPAIIEKFVRLKIPVYNLNYEFEDGYSLIDQFKKAFLKRKYYQKNAQNIELIRSLKADILHSHTLPRELLLIKQAAKYTNSRVLYTDHSARLNKNEINPLSRILIRFPFREFYRQVYVAAVGYAVQQYLKDFSIDKILARLEVLTNKLSPNAFRISYEIRKEYKVVYVSRIFNAKGHEDLIRAWKLLPSLHLHLYVVGPDNLEGKIQRLAQESSFNNKISFTGSINNVSEFIRDADIGVFPSHKEGLPIALLEKMQIGIPCVVSDIDELKSIIKDQWNGLLFRCRDEADLANKIMLLTTDLMLREKLGTNAAVTVSEKYVSKIGGIGREYETLYKKIAAH